MKKNLLVAAAGAVLAVVGALMVVLWPERGALVALPYLCIGVGCGALGYGLGEWAAAKARQKDPAMAERMEIEQQDERNIAITRRAKAKAFDLMLYVFGALLLAFALAGVQLWAVLTLVGAYLLLVVVQVACIVHYQKEM